MKHLITLIVLLTSLFVQAQEADSFTGDADNHPRNPQQDQISFVPNEVLVKFRDDVQVNGGTLLKSAGIKAVDRLLQDKGIEGLQKLFPSETRLKSARVVKDPHGQDMVIPSLHNIYKIVLPQLKSTQAAPPDIFGLIEDLQQLPEVEYAEPNYIFSVDDLKAVGPELTAFELANQYSQQSAGAAYVPNDPMYGQQWYIPAIKADLVWGQTTGDSSQVIAILDTGVDTSHPDLKNKIWRNPGEIAGNGMDDDGNGLVDDIMGWDYINSDNNPMDDNSHGTHVAGIAAAEANNGIGIAGINWHARIMPIKVFQSSGRGDAAKISQGIIYATQKGATVINMSFGSYARSMTMETALTNAYATAVLVAAAGNDAKFLEFCQPNDTTNQTLPFETMAYLPSESESILPFFPAALSYVLGVQSPESNSSNLDCNGPTFSTYSELFNYEMKAPGSNIVSTVPNGNYKILNGTSMSTPIISGAVALFRNLNSQSSETRETMWVKLIQATEQFLDINKALNIVPKPEIAFLNKVLIDTIYTNDNDGRVDAGETIQLWFRARNTGGQIDSVIWKLRLARSEDPENCSIIKNSSYMGKFKSFETRTNENDPVKIKIGGQVTHGNIINFELLSYNSTSDTLIQKLAIQVENGEELSGILDTKKTLVPDRIYLVNQNFKVGTNGILIIKPGTQILFYPNYTIPVNGKVIAEGKPDSLIYFKGWSLPTQNAYNIFQFNSHTRLTFCKFENIQSPISGSASAFNCIFETFRIGEVDTLVDCQYLGWGAPTENPKYLYRNNLISTSRTRYDYPILEYVSGNNGFTKHNIFLNFGMNSNSTNTNPELQNAWISETNKNWENTLNLDNRQVIKFTTPYYSTSDFHFMQYQYWGTNDSLKIEDSIVDFVEYSISPKAVFSPFLSAPPEECHGVVWKVLVNGKDAQDEIVDPLGVGTHRFDVYFNRAMDKTITPMVSFGVREPYNQQLVNENGFWSEDGKIYTAYKTVKLTTGDGINRVRVSGAKEADGWDWEIPVEDQRFEFLVSAASSASNEFMATPGLGKVDLEWNDNDLEDGLGYNMYRMQQINDSTLSAPVMINQTLITDTLYSDFAVVPNQKYFYYYKILRTSLEETDSSKVVAAVPYTASLGDANGDLVVNVLDVTSIVAYLLNQDPKPFIFDAADVNGDQQINVLDIVATVNLVLNPTKAAITASTETVNLYMVNDTLFADAPVAISAIQFDITGVEGISDIERLSALNGFESGFSVNDHTMRLIVYSLTGKTIPAGNRIPLLKLKKGSGITQMVMGDKNGAPLAINYITTGLWNLSDLGDGVATLGQNYPNPFDRSTIIPVMIHEPVDEALIRIVNINGQQVAVLPLKNPVIGENLIQWEPGNNKGLMAYILEIRRNGQQVVSGVRKMIAR